MALDGEYRQTAVTHAFYTTIVEIFASDFKTVWKTVTLNSPAMIFGGDQNTPGAVFTDRLIGATMAEFELIDLGAKG